MSGLKCSIVECKKRCTDVKNMSFSELEEYNTKCQNCGDWIFKTEEIANKTYNKVSNKWAEEFMNRMIEKR